MEKAYWLGRKRTLPDSNARIIQRAVILCAVAVPVVGFNILASSHNDATILYWSLAMTAGFVLACSAFVLWAANLLWPAKAHIRPATAAA